jgi:aldose sugar dehydrogenase
LKFARANLGGSIRSPLGSPFDDDVGYQNDIFVGDINYGNLYHFDLYKNRTALDLEDENGLLADRIADTSLELGGVIFARGFGGISDTEVGPCDGYLYIVSHREGSIYRIIPNDK